MRKTLVCNGGGPRRRAAIGISKTSILGGRPWKMSVQYWNFIEAPEAFATEHQLRFTVGPVVALPWKGRR